VFVSSSAFLLGEISREARRVLGPRSSAAERPDGVDTTATSRPLVRCAHAGIVSVLAFLSQVRPSPLSCAFLFFLFCFLYSLFLRKLSFSLLVPSSDSLFSSLLNLYLFVPLVVPLFLHATYKTPSLLCCTRSACQTHSYQRTFITGWAHESRRLESRRLE
jgi:hypothetical protein